MRFIICISSMHVAMVSRNIFARLYAKTKVSRSCYLGLREILQKMRLLLLLQVCFVNVAEYDLKASPAGRVYEEKVRAKKNE